MPRKKSTHWPRKCKVLVAVPVLVEAVDPGPNVDPTCRQFRKALRDAAVSQLKRGVRHGTPRAITAIGDGRDQRFGCRVLIYEAENSNGPAVYEATTDESLKAACLKIFLDSYEDDGVDDDIDDPLDEPIPPVLGLTKEQVDALPEDSQIRAAIERVVMEYETSHARWAVAERRRQLIAKCLRTHDGAIAYHLIVRDNILDPDKVQVELVVFPDEDRNRVGRLRTKTGR